MRGWFLFLGEVLFETNVNNPPKSEEREKKGNTNIGVVGLG